MVDESKRDESAVMATNAVAPTKPKPKPKPKPKTRANATAKSKTKARAKSKPWSKRAERTFLEHLAVTANVEASCRKARLASSTVYGRRRRNAALRTVWAEALAEGYGVLEAELLKRAIAGVEKPVFRAGVEVGKVREYSDAMAMGLLRRHGDLVRENRERMARATTSDSEARSLLAEMLDEIRERLDATEAEILPERMAIAGPTKSEAVVDHSRSKEDGRDAGPDVDPGTGAR